MADSIGNEKMKASIPATYPWLATTWQNFVRQPKQQLPHAIGLPFHPGLATPALIDALISWVLCLEPTEQGACGICKSCSLLQSQNHPDYIRVAPEEGKRIGIDTVRDIQTKLMRKSTQSDFTVVVIEQAEWMTVPAANALLKTLEEPQPHTLLFVCPQNSSLLLPTVKSRLTMLSIPVATPQETKLWLVQQGVTNISEQDIEQACLEPLTWLHTHQGQQEQGELFLLLLKQGESLLPQKQDEVLAWFDDLIDSLMRGVRFAHYGIHNPNHPVEQQWQTLFAAYPALEQQLMIWYTEALGMKAHFLAPGLNARHLILPLLSSIRLFYALLLQQKRQQQNQ